MSGAIPRLVLAAALLLSLATCRGAGGPATSATEVAIAEEHAIEPAEVEPRSAIAFDIVDESASMVVLLDATALRNGELFKTVEQVTAAVPGVSRHLTDLEADCGFDPIHGVSRAAFSASFVGDSMDSESAVLAFEASETAQAVFACVKGLAAEEKVDEVEVEGQPALAFAGAHLAEYGGVFVLAEKPRVERALRGRNSGLRLAPDEYLYVSIALDNDLGVQRAEFRIGESAGRLRASLVADMTSNLAATQIVRLAEQQRKQVGEQLDTLETLEVPHRRFLAEQLAAVHFEAQGTRASATLDIEGGDAAEALTGVLGAVVTRVMRRMMTAERITAVATHVADIAEGLKNYAEGKGKGLLPKSAPLVPAQVPTSAVRSSKSAWQHASWKAIDFAIEGDQFFAYEFVTRKDRKSAMVKAHGDFMGDGNVGVLVTTVTVEKDGSVNITTSGIPGLASP